MGEKLHRAWKTNKKYLISFLILWFLLTIVFVVPLSCGIVEGTINGKFSIAEFLNKFVANLTGILGAYGKIFTEPYIGMFFNVLGKYTIGYLVICFIGFLRMIPKNEFMGIEHGSSDWAENGEQYRVLDRKKGIILAEENYLPLDKRGNTNVLIVGRIWIR